MIRQNFWNLLEKKNAEIYLLRSWLASQGGVEPSAPCLGVDPIRWNQVQHSARKSLEIQGFSQFQILSGITLHKHFHRDFTPSNWLEISKAFDFWRTLQVQDNVTMYLLVMRSDRFFIQRSQATTRNSCYSWYSITFFCFFFNRLLSFYSVECFGLYRTM